jgi:3-hydroxybutyryl-CoA dehydrogenase
MNSFLIASENHPLYSVLMKQEIPCYTINHHLDLDMIEDHQDATVLDFTLMGTVDKIQLLTILSERFDIVSDLSCAWGDLLHHKFVRLRASFAAAFYSPKAALEVHTPYHSHQKLLSDFFNKLNLTTLYVQQSGHGFIFPRTISMIINEAYFSIEDELASPAAIDTAMLFGVNYPLGPIDWSKKIGLAPICLLLDDLYTTTKDERYRLSTHLKYLNT